MRSIELSQDERITLEELVNHHRNARQRQRAHSLLLSARGFSINEIARIYEVDRDTVSSWLSRWERLGLVGLQDAPRSGTPPKLSEAEQHRVVELLQVHARSAKAVAGAIEQETGKAVSPDTIKRIGKKARRLWKRIRTALRSKRDPLAFAEARQALAELRARHSRGEIELYFFDATGFSLWPCIPYAWQPLGQWIEIAPVRSQRVNVLGFLSPNRDLTSFVFEGRIDTQAVIACFEAFANTREKPTYVVLDNAPQHTSYAFKACHPTWEARHVFLYYLPPYSPELNLIEVVWRFIKYHWLPFSAYASYQTLKQAVEEILTNFGMKYQITFT
jgi:transposase